MKRDGIQQHLFGNARSPNKIDMLNLYQPMCTSQTSLLFPE